MASAHLAIAGVLVLAIIAHAAYVPARAVEEEEARELSPNLMENADADPAMEAKEEEEDADEEGATLLEALRSLIREDLKEDEENLQPAKRTPTPFSRFSRCRRCSRSRRRGRSGGRGRG